MNKNRVFLFAILLFFLIYIAYMSFIFLFLFFLDRISFPLSSNVYCTISLNLCIWTCTSISVLNSDPWIQMIIRIIRAGTTYTNVMLESHRNRTQC